MWAKGRAPPAPQELQPQPRVCPDSSQMPGTWPPTCDIRHGPQLPHGGNRWQVPRSWGWGWLAHFQNSSTLPTQDAPPGGTQRGAASPPPAQMGRVWGLGGWGWGRALRGSSGWGGVSSIQCCMTWSHLFSFLGLIFPIWTMGNGMVKGFSGHSPGTRSARVRGGVCRLTVQPGGRWAQHGHCPPMGCSAGQGLECGSARGASEGREGRGFHTQGPGHGFPLELWAACCPTGLTPSLSLSPVQAERGFLKQSLDTPRKKTRAQDGPRAWAPTREHAPQSTPVPHPTWPPHTWKKAALARRTRKLWEPPVGMGAKGEGRVWGQSGGLCSQTQEVGVTRGISEDTGLRACPCSLPPCQLA